MSGVTGKDRSYWIVRVILYILFHTLLRIEIIGQENLNVDGACLVITNHLSVLDLPLLLTLFPRRGWGLAADKYRRHPIWGPILHLIGVIFVHQGKGDRRALQAALSVLQEGGVVGLNPEGTRSKTGQLQPARTGVAYLAVYTGATIIPVAITGTERAVRALVQMHRQQVRIVIGLPFKLPSSNDPVTGPQLTAYTEFIMCKLAALLPESYRGYYRDRRTPSS
jgi:1-acyl-sn-glycerol-3-phosphate acyltransferase